MWHMLMSHVKLTTTKYLLFSQYLETWVTHGRELHESHAQFPSFRDGDRIDHTLTVRPMSVSTKNCLLTLEGGVLLLGQLSNFSYVNHFFMPKTVPRQSE